MIEILLLSLNVGPIRGINANIQLYIKITVQRFFELASETMLEGRVFHSGWSTCNNQEMADS